MANNKLQWFYAERARRFQEATQKLENNDVGAVKQYLEWADTATKLFAPAQHAALRKWAMVVTGVAVLLVGLAWTLRIHFTHVALEVTTENVRFTLQKEWSCNPLGQTGACFVGNKLTIDNLARIDAPGVLPGSPVNAADGTAVLDVRGAEINVTDLRIAAGAEIEFGIQGKELQLFVKKAALTGTLQVQQASVTIEPGADREPIPLEIAAEIPETMTFTTAQTGAVPVLLTLTTSTAWRLRDVPAQKLDFVTEYPSTFGHFVSALRTGRITLRETDLKKDLRDGEYLTLKSPVTRRLELTTSDQGDIKVMFEGSAARILVGSEDFKEDLTPTYFEYIARQKRLTIFWSAVVFIGGLIWKIRSLDFLIEPKQK
ncbi:hypothetical protein U27_04691 [Candidatus Vecturithrix granuli]|uniref:Uncharacterized protein n=1 Tax=Vecturithrix granuli TaxID=1499967 RepID=A0A081BZG9_VECG1|nr:hypothetical protein U27_04691 [Candidatus Vecturithrix granuli]